MQHTHNTHTHTHTHTMQVYIANPPPGRYTITIQASYLFIAARPQPYALVALGGFQGELASAANPAYKLARSRS